MPGVPAVPAVPLSPGGPGAPGVPGVPGVPTPGAPATQGVLSTIAGCFHAGTMKSSARDDTDLDFLGFLEHQACLQTRGLLHEGTPVTSEPTYIKRTSEAGEWSDTHRVFQGCQVSQEFPQRPASH